MNGGRLSDLAFLFDVDNTLLDNDRVTRDLSDHLVVEYGEEVRDRYFGIFEDVRRETGYADYLGALQRYRLEDMRDPRVLRLSFWLLDYPFAERLYPRALEVVACCAHRRDRCGALRRRRGVPATEGRALWSVGGVRRTTSSSTSTRNASSRTSNVSSRQGAT